MKLLILLLLCSCPVCGFIEVNKQQVHIGEGVEYWFDQPHLTFWIEHNGVIVKPKTIAQGSSTRFFKPRHLGVYNLIASNKSLTFARSIKVVANYESATIKSRRIASWLLSATCVFLALGTLWIKKN